MCLLVLAWQAHPRYPLIVAANRDEFHDRPALPLAKWPSGKLDESKPIYGGRDLRAGGTWLAVDNRRRFGVITNFREVQRPEPGSPSRGGLIPSYLSQDHGAGEFLAALKPESSRFAAFNLLLSDEQSLWYASNRIEGFARRLEPGLHGLSNQYLDTPWPKLLRVRRQFATWLEHSVASDTAALFEILADRTRAGSDDELPHSGLDTEWERTLSSPFVLDPRYGTRCSTIVMMETSGSMLIAERRFDPDGRATGETELLLNA
jgi:uncharacterized protein with NRDE domain